MNSFSHNIRALLAQADALRNTDSTQAIALYWQVLKQDAANLHAHHALEDLQAPDRWSAWMNVNCQIAEQDEIFQFFASHYLARNPIREYLADGWRTLSQLMLLLEDADRPLRKVSSFLEFASGFGRFTRHLTKVLPGKVTVSDVQPGSVEFATTQFGVQGFASAYDPAQIQYPQQYEVVFVLSLFSHVPPASWPTWLQSLRRAVAPGGLLVFSTHGALDARLRGVQLDKQGTYFVASSESTSLDTQAYGTTCASEAFTREQVAQALGSAVLLYREAAFWNAQDAVVWQAPQ